MLGSFNRLVKRIILFLIGWTVGGYNWYGVTVYACQDVNRV